MGVSGREAAFRAGGVRLGRPVACALAVLLATGAAEGAGLEWPPVTRETRPWTRWWWMGSSVDPAGLTTSLEAYRAVGLGGVEVTPIYGVRGFEERFVPYLSPEWMGLFAHVLREGQRLDLGVDMATGTGWPFGGPWVGEAEACRWLAHRTWTLKGGERLADAIRYRQEPLLRSVGGSARIDELVEPVQANPDLQVLALDQVRFPRPLPLQALVATSDAGETVDLTSRVRPDGTLDWTAPLGSWRLDGAFAGWHGKMVERAAPGGEGNVVDHFCPEAVGRYLARFDEAFAGHDLAGLRGFFNDSYEVDDSAGQADWTPALFEEFKRRRGYDLRQHLPALFGEDTEEASTRVLADYRETVSDLLLDAFTARWRGWAAGRGKLARDQAHGSPGSLLDLYAASDIPETEGRDILRMKWASSAAHVAGRRLVAAEAATWLGEHFLSTLADVRAAVDDFFLGGVNHVVYHGTCDSPPDEPWPGWLFYASVHFNLRNPWWEDFSTLNGYVTRVQSFLQSGRPDADVLLYHPFYDALAERGTGLLAHFGDGRGTEPQNPVFRAAAELLLARGYAFDFVSDRQVRALRHRGGRLESGDTSWATIVLPACRFIPVETFEALVGLAREGATVVVVGRLPSDVAGLGDLEARRARYTALASPLRFDETSGARGRGVAGRGDGGDVKAARIGRGVFLLGEDLEALLARVGVTREPMVDRGLWFVRRDLEEGRAYFVVNRADSAVDGWVPLATGARSVAVFDPMDSRRGYAPVRPAGAGATEVYLQLGPGESLVLVTGSTPATAGSFPFHEPAGPPTPIEGEWTIRFVAGGPERPAEIRTNRLASWTRLGGAEARSFSGTARYSIAFPRPSGRADAWRLDLGPVAHSARVRLNDRDLGVLIGPGYRLTVDDAMLGENNRLEVDVTNLMANRIADLDRRGVRWRRFYNVNFPPRLPENRGPDGLFDASRWEPLDSGLLGPVTLTPLEAVRLPTVFPPSGSRRRPPGRGAPARP